MALETETKARFQFSDDYIITKLRNQLTNLRNYDIKFFDNKKYILSSEEKFIFDRSIALRKKPIDFYIFKL